MHYDLVTPVDNVFNKVKEILENGDMVNFPYSHPHAISKAYNIINKTGKLRRIYQGMESPSSNPEDIDCIQDKFCEAHLELTETVKLTLEQADYRQDNIVEDLTA